MTTIAEFKSTQPPTSKRYDSLSFSVSNLNDQITELVAANEGLEGEIDVLETQIKNARRQMAKNERAAERLRSKRDIVAEAAFKASRVDLP